jgi:hypothetical protein
MVSARIAQLEAEVSELKTPPVLTAALQSIESASTEGLKMIMQLGGVSLDVDVLARANISVWSVVSGMASIGELLIALNAEEDVFIELLRLYTLLRYVHQHHCVPEDHPVAAWIAQTRHSTYAQSFQSHRVSVEMMRHIDVALFHAPLGIKALPFTMIKKDFDATHPPRGMHACTICCIDSRQQSSRDERSGEHFRGNVCVACSCIQCCHSRPYAAWSMMNIAGLTISVLIVEYVRSVM